MVLCFIMVTPHGSRDPGDGDVLEDVAFLKLDLDVHSRPSLHWESWPLGAAPFTVGVSCSSTEGCAEHLLLLP